jgi:hypothetical protein
MISLLATHGPDLVAAAVGLLLLMIAGAGIRGSG